MSSKITGRKEHFQDRHIGPSEDEIKEMLQEMKLSSVEELLDQTLPADIRKSEELDLPLSLSEYRLLKELKERVAGNKMATTYIGMGYYDTVIPPVIQRNVLENPGWYTQYTPYQAEISQGRLESLLNFQTLVMDLTGMELANSSLLDEGTAAAEAMHMMRAVNKKAGPKFFVSNKLFPQTMAIIETRAEPIGVELVYGPTEEFEPTEDYFGAILQFPDGNGKVTHYADFIDRCHDAKVMVCVAADLMSLILYTPPGELGADVVIGSAQRFGVPMGYGGPHAAFFATREEYKRQVPGRIIGVSQDRYGNMAFRMALQTREQHIKRDKATSNICTAQALLANISAMYAVYHGPHGLKEIASRINLMARIAAYAVEKMGLTELNEFFFDTLKVEANSAQIESIRQSTVAKGINLRYYNDNAHFGISMDETTDFDRLQELIDAIADGLECESQNVFEIADIIGESDWNGMQRISAFLTHPIFNSFYSETEMLRYLKRLENKDLSLAHTMIPLGSCTMKLNATAEMIPVTWPELANIHPFAPLDQTTFYQEMFAELSDQLKAITGFAGISLQPNAGAQGEYTGLMVIRKYLRSTGQGNRHICLIPASAHGTNPASAVMAGMKVVVIKTDPRGNIDVDDLREKAEKHKDSLAALMVTYPSTHGVFEQAIKEICEIIHDNGGQVYMDGANMNAQVGLTSPGDIGADVCHLNLHKTFCIPHGGGGPGMGPIGVATHLVPYLPNHPIVSMSTDRSINAVSAAPWGSASILVISYIYNRLMGREGLTNATRVAILSANYIAERLNPHYPVLYSGKNDRVAHELIIDLREFKKAGVEAEDVAKRLIDYGFHAPTLSFPVPGTLMIEPTESESKAEIDRFIEALISIRGEIEELANGTADPKDNVLKNAPHTLAELSADEWEHKYSRQKAAYPAGWLTPFKFWASVGRVDNTYGDRNLVCACPPMEDYMEDIIA